MKIKKIKKNYVLGIFAISGPQGAFLLQNLGSTQEAWYIDFSWGL